MVITGGSEGGGGLEATFWSEGEKERIARIQTDCLTFMVDIDILTKNNKGIYTVLRMGDCDQRLHKKYGGKNARDKALAEARRLTAEGMKDASDTSVAVVYHTYDPQGNYIGGQE